MTRQAWFPSSAALPALVCAVGVPAARGATPAEMLAGNSAQAGKSPVPASGQQFFASVHGCEYSASRQRRGSA
jgi:hypothetical protein